MAGALRIRAAIAALGLLTGTLPVAAQETAVVPTRIIYPGDVVSAGALDEVALKPGKSLNGAYASAIEQISGKVARRTLLPGRLIPMNSVRQAYVVEQGVPVQVVLVQGAMTISITAVTLQPGSAGDQVRVRNMDSGVVFNGIVMADGTIRVGAT